MRRIARLFTAIFVASALSACGGGGSVLSFSRDAAPDRTIVTAPGSTNIARVLPGASIALSAIGVKGSANGVLSGNTYRWSAALTSGLQYPSNTIGDTKPCQTVTITTGGVTTPYTPDFSIYIAIDPVNEANIIFLPPTFLPAPVGSVITINYPYCVLVSAQPGVITGSGLGAVFNPVGTPGSIIVAVVNPQNPLQ